MDTSSAVSSDGLVSSRTETYFERFLALWEDSKALPEARLAFGYFIGLAFLCGATAFIGAVPTRIFGHDVFLSLDNGWRVINGQIPHVDFVSSWGPVWYLASALGLSLSGHSANGIGYGNAIVALIVGCWSFFLSRNRLTSSARILLGFFLAALVAAPYPLGFPFYLSSHAMVYNRYGYALLGLILLECLAPARDSEDGREEGWIGGISTGAALGLALFLKASYVLMAAVVIGVTSLYLRRLGYRRLLGVAAGFCGVSLCFLAYLHFDVAAMLGDLRMAGGAREGAIHIRLLVQNALNNASVLLGVVLFGFVVALLLGDRVRRWRGLALPLMGAFLFFADFGLISTNAQLNGFPICAVFAILVLSVITEQQQSLPRAETRAFHPLYAGALCLGALLFVPQLTSDLAGLGYGAWRKHSPSTSDPVRRFTSPNLASLLLYDYDPNASNGRTFTIYVNDGVALLQQESHADETILNMDMTNPFSYALERRPPHGGITSPTYHYNIDDRHRPSDDQFFGDADIVMVPKRPALDSGFYADFYKAYEPGLKQRYKLAGESGWWWMYRRK